MINSLSTKLKSDLAIVSYFSDKGERTTTTIDITNSEGRTTRATVDDLNEFVKAIELHNRGLNSHNSETT